MTLTVWSLAHTASTPTGVCKVRSDYVAITCASGGAFVDARDALMSQGGPHTTRFPCRIIGRDDQGDLRCAPGKPTIDYDATEVLRSFARKCALDVVHLWKAPPVVKRYLRTGNPKFRVAARNAAEAAAEAVAQDIARAMAEATVGATAWATTTWDAVWGAAVATAEATTRGTAGAVAAGVAARTAVAAEGAAEGATETAAGATAGATAGGAAKDAARARQSRRLARMLQAGARGSR